jgi:hypothetical protein
VDPWGTPIQYFTINERWQMEDDDGDGVWSADLGSPAMWLPVSLAPPPEGDLRDLLPPNVPLVTTPVYQWMIFPPNWEHTPPPSTPKLLFISAGPDRQFGYCGGPNEEDSRTIAARRDNIYSTHQPPTHDPTASNTALQWWYTGLEESDGGPSDHTGPGGPGGQSGGGNPGTGP